MRSLVATISLTLMLMASMAAAMPSCSGNICAIPKLNPADTDSNAIISENSISPNDYRQISDSQVGEFGQVGILSPADLVFNHISADLVSRSLAVSSAKPDTLPAVPGAILMTLLGFGLITLVRDRKFWISALMLMVVIGQSGVRSLPKLTSSLAGTQDKFSVTVNNLAGKIAIADSPRANRNFTITFTGLLHRLAGSDQKDAYANIASLPGNIPLDIAPYGHFNLKSSYSIKRNPRLRKGLRVMLSS